MRHCKKLLSHESLLRAEHDRNRKRNRPRWRNSSIKRGKTVSNRFGSIRVGHPHSPAVSGHPFVETFSLRPLTAVYFGGLSMRKYALALCLLVLCTATAVQAQIPTATLSGIVMDAHGALIQGARV